MHQSPTPRSRSTRVAERQLQERIDRDRTLVEYGTLIPWTTEPDGSVTDMPFWREFTGQTSAEVRGWGWLDAVHPDDREQTRVIWEQAVATMSMYETEYRVRRTDGSYCDFLARALPIMNPDGTLREWTGYCADITDRKELEADLAERASQMESTIASIPDGVIIYDARGSITHYNTHADVLLGLSTTPQGFLTLGAIDRMDMINGDLVYTINDAQGKRMSEEEIPSVRMLRGETLTGSQAVDMEIHTPDQRIVRVNVSAAPFRDANGTIRGGICIWRDVTERRQMEEERLQMLDIVAHELKTPLTALKLMTQTLQRRLTHKREIEPRHFETIDHSLDRMDRLINDLLDATRLDRGSMELGFAQHDLATMCREAAQEQMAASGREVTLDLPDSPVTAEVDAERITQVITNLLSNALKYSPTETPVTLKLTHEPPFARVEISDRGPGIPQESLAYLFDRFYRAPEVSVLHGSGVGLGLGLHISQALIAAHRGEIGVDSTLGHGSTFWFTVPLPV